MGHINRGRLTVDLDGKWWLYTNTIPAGAKALGTVSRDTGDMGALVLIEATGIYVQLNAGCLKSLDQSKVKAAINNG